MKKTIDEEKYKKSVEAFRFYKKTLITKCKISETPYLDTVKTKEIFNIKEFKKALLLSYTDNYDCGFETDWWYVVFDRKVDFLTSGSKRSRYEIRRALSKCKVMVVDPKEYETEIIDCWCKSIEGYKSYKKQKPKLESTDTKKFILAFDAETNQVVGYSIISFNDSEVFVQKMNTIRMNNYSPSLALNIFIIDNFMTDNRIVVNGHRTIVHVTNYNDFLEDKLQFRKAYCCLNVVLNPRYALIIKTLYCARHFLRLFDFLYFFHQINSFLKMYEISRKCKKQFNK